jgi:acetyl esterase
LLILEVAMAVDPQLLGYYASLKEHVPTATSTHIEDIRQHMRDVAAHQAIDIASNVHVSELTLPLVGRALKALVFRVPGRVQAAAPLMVYFHGGGWAVGSPQTHAAICAGLAQDTGCTVVSVDYRLAPEHPYPVPCDDARDALAYLVGQRDVLGCRTDWLAVAGDSAGAHLAAQAALALAGSDGPQVNAQLLIYPAVTPTFGSDSYAAFAEGPGLTRTEMVWYWQQFLGGDVHASCVSETALSDPRINLLAATPAQIPPDTVIIAAGHDVLRDDALRYADFLVEHGAQVVCLEASGMTHSFARLQSHSARARQWMERAAMAFANFLPDT